LTPRSLPPKNIVLPTNSMFSYPEAGNGYPLFGILGGRDSNNKMQESGGLLLADGSTAATQ